MNDREITRELVDANSQEFSHSGRALVAEEEHRHRAGAGGPFFALFGAYQRTVRGAAAKELNVAVASVSASTCVLPSSAAYMLCSSG